MSKQLNQKNKIFLLAAAFLIAGGWFLPTIVKKLLNSETLTTAISKKTNTDSATAEVNKYLKDLELMSAEEQAKILGIKNPLITGTSVDNLTGNNKTATAKVRIYIVNSYLERTIYLVRNNDLWEVEKIEGGNALFYRKDGVIIKHDLMWEAFSSNFGEGIENGWILRNNEKGSENAEVGVEIMFFTEPVGGPYTKVFTDCSSEGVSDCQTETLGKHSVRSAVYEKMIKVYVFEPDNGEKNVIALVELGLPKESMDGVISVLQNIKFE